MTQTQYMLDGLSCSFRNDGRDLATMRPYKVIDNVLQNSLGSACVEYGDGKKLLVAITGEVANPKGYSKVFIESIAESNLKVKQKLIYMLSEYVEPFLPVIPISANNGWGLNIDVLLYFPMSLTDIDYIVLGIKKAFKNLELPFVKENKNDLTGETKLELCDSIVKGSENDCPRACTIGVV